jgi:hypothetical protein
VSRKTKLVSVIAALALVAIAGGAYAATQSSTTPRQAFLNDAAKRLNVSPAKLRSALQGALIDRLNAAVAAGRITKAQATAIEKRIQQGGRVGLGARGFFGHRFFHRFGPGGPGGPGFAAPAGPRMGPLGAAASYLGVSPMQLFKDLSSGKSLAQVAKSKNKSVSGLKSAILNSLKSRLDKAVSAKMITSTQEQRILNRLSSRLTEKINHAGYGPRFGGGPVGHPPFGPAAPATP